MKKLKVNLKDRSYDISIGSGILGKAKELFNLDRKVFILTDDGVPSEYAKTIAGASKTALVYTIPQGEKSKTIETYIDILKKMTDFNLTRTDAMVGVGGGVVGDLTGFCASTYMRGIDFYNVPTTMLSMVDSSIGGKTGVDFMGIKNGVGTFCQPKGVLIDTETLNTLPDRHFLNGLTESIKMAATFDEKLFSLIESKNAKDNIEDIIYKSLSIKKKVVEKDEKEKGLRKVLNFGHTLAHAIEGVSKMQDILHGEAVAIGMVKSSSGLAKERIIKVLNSYGLNTEYSGDKNELIEFIKHDKKCTGNFIDIIKTDKIGKFSIVRETVEKFIGEN